MYNAACALYRLTMSQKLPLSVFYSYARADRTVFGMFVNGLRKVAEQRGLKLDDWYDENIANGHVWREEIGTQIDNRRAMIVLLTEMSVTREEVEKEVKAALEKGKFVLPILFDTEVRIPEYLKSYQAIKAYEYSTHFDDLYTKVLETITNSSQVRNPAKRNKHNLYVASASRRGGLTSIIAAFSQLLVDGYHYPGYFKPFHKKNDSLWDVEFLLDQFKLSEINLSPQSLTPFEYAANVPTCTEIQLSDQFERISNDRRPVMIEGILSKPKNMTLRQLIVDILDARLLLVFDHMELERMTNETPAELLYRVRADMGDVPAAFVFNKVPVGGMSDFAQEVRQVALDLRFKEVGEIPYDERLSALSLEDVLSATGAQLISSPETVELDDLVWRTGHTSFTDQEAYRFYEQQNTTGENKGRIIFSGASKLGINLPLARMGYHLLLTGMEPTPYIDTSVLEAAAENRKAILYFQGPTDRAVELFNNMRTQGVPFCSLRKLEYLMEATAKLDKSTIESIVRRL
jgi:hypothetical protein